MFPIQNSLVFAEKQKPMRKEDARCCYFVLSTEEGGEQLGAHCPSGQCCSEMLCQPGMKLLPSSFHLFRAKKCHAPSPSRCQQRFHSAHLHHHCCCFITSQDASATPVTRAETPFSLLLAPVERAREILRPEGIICSVKHSN